LYTNFLEFFFVLVFSYLVGSIPSGLILSKIFHKNDPRISGSQNIGATNILRLSGWKLGLATLLMDISKGFFVLLLFTNSLYLNVAILFVFFGHLYPLWLKLKGGKGVAVFLGILLQYDFFIALIFIVTWILFALIFKYSSLSAIISSLIILIIFYLKNDAQILVFGCIVFFILCKHITNISRLISGNESKINFKK